MGIKYILLTCICIAAATGFSQNKPCKIKNYLGNDGTMYYFVPADTIYYTHSKSLLGGVTTDKEQFFLTLVPFPQPKIAGKIKSREYKPLKITMANGEAHSLDFFDARVMKDSSFVLFYLIDPKKNSSIDSIEIDKVEIHTPLLNDTFKLHLHKKVFIDHINCLSSLKNLH